MTGHISAYVFAICALAITTGVVHASRAQAPAPKAPTTVATSPASYPEATITNGTLRVHLYLPDAERGFYRSTRFDWSGVIHRVEFGGHRFYGQWFARTDSAVRDFTFSGPEIVASAQSATVGPAEEFRGTLGYAAAKPGETFIKIGVGRLRKSDTANYSNYATYELVDSGTWKVDVQKDSVTFSQHLSDEPSGYGYEYTKTVRLVPGTADMVIAHSLKNIGRLPIQGNQYNHNFLMIDGEPTGPDYAIRVPYDIQAPARPIDPAQATIAGGTISYTKPVSAEERVSMGMAGFGPTPASYDIRVENRKAGAGVRITANRPMTQIALWSIRSVLAAEPTVDVSTEPGATTTWDLTYTYYNVK